MATIQLARQNKPIIDLADPKLFGNEAADFEDLSTFLSYALDRDEVTRCLVLLCY
jgi:hypothetical protein